MGLGGEPDRAEDHQVEQHLERVPVVAHAAQSPRPPCRPVARHTQSRQSWRAGSASWLGCFTRKHDWQTNPRRAAWAGSGRRDHPGRRPPPPSSSSSAPRPGRPGGPEDGVEVGFDVVGVDEVLVVVLFVGRHHPAWGSSSSLRPLSGTSTSTRSLSSTVKVSSSTSTRASSSRSSGSMRLRALRTRPLVPRTPLRQPSSPSLENRTGAPGPALPVSAA